jgi:hypothetical protein
VGLTGALLRGGAARPHVLIAAVPGGTVVRLAAEAEARRRGWPCALTPADTDLLLVAGIAPGEFGDVLEEVWRAVPAPRVRAQASGPDEVPALLDAARAGLGDLARQRAADPAARQPLAAAAGPAMGAGHAHGGNGHGSGADEDHDGGGHGHDGEGMEMPGGLAIAGRGEDRDGLKLDQLHVPVGPVLPDWPAGLVVHVTLQGDVVQHASVRAVGVGREGRSFWAEPWRRAAAGDLVPAGAAARRLLASHLDSLGRLLAVAGWGDAAVTARRLRDEALADAPAAVLEPAARRFAGRVARSRVLGWLTRGLGILGAGEAAAAGVRGPALRAGGDVTARYRRWCRELVEAAALLGAASPVDPGVLEPPRGRLEGAGAPSAGLMAVLPRLLAGAEFAAARLIVASLDPDLDELTAAAVWAGAGHGG